FREALRDVLDVPVQSPPLVNNDDRRGFFKVVRTCDERLDFQTVALECFSACRDFCLFRHGKTPLDIMADCQTGVQKFDFLRDVGKRGKYNEKAKSAQAAEEDRGSKIEDRGSRVEDRGSKITLRVITRSSIFYLRSSILGLLRFASD